MSITDRAAIVLQQIGSALALAEKATPGPWRNFTNPYNNVRCVTGAPRIQAAETANSLADIFCYSDEQDEANATFIATSRTLLPASLRCLKTAIEGLLAAREWNEQTGEEFMPSYASLTLASLLDTWEATK